MLAVELSSIIAGASSFGLNSKLYPYNAISIATIQNVKRDCYLLLWVIIKHVTSRLAETGQTQS